MTIGASFDGRQRSATDAAHTDPEARHLVHQRLVAEPSQTVEITPGRHSGAGIVDTIARRVAQLRQVDDFIGGRELRPPVERELQLTASLLRDAAYIDWVSLGLLGALASAPSTCSSRPS